MTTDVMLLPELLPGSARPNAAELAHLRHDVVRERAALVVAADDRRDHVAGDLRQGIPQVLLLRCELVTSHMNTFAGAAANPAPGPVV